MTLLHNISRTLQRRRNITWHALGYDTRVRPEAADDVDAIASLTHATFHRDAEVTLIQAIRQHCPEHISLVAEQHGNIVGHIMFTPAALDNQPTARLVALAPMAVSNVLQHQGIGSSLVRAGLMQCKQQGAMAAIVRGKPDYYHRFGFLPASQFNLQCPDSPDDATYMLLPLTTLPFNGNNGRVIYHPAFRKSGQLP